MTALAFIGLLGIFAVMAALLTYAVLDVLAMVTL
jgi:hypothetical protein